MNPAEELRHWANTIHFTDAKTVKWPLGTLQLDEADPIGRLASAIYETMYTRAPANRKPGADRLTKQEFTGQLDRNNLHQVEWDEGWQIESRDNGVLVRRGSNQLRVGPGDYIERNGKVLVRIPRSSSRAQPGWFNVSSDSALASSRPRLVRVYWHITKPGAFLLTRTLTKELNNAHIPFRFKIVDDPWRFQRADAAVLYLEKGVWDSALPFVSDVYTVTSPYMNSEVPALTKPLARGLGFAEDPMVLPGALPGETSFGTHRCRVVASALHRAYVETTNTAQDRYNCIERAFREVGLNPDLPYLNPGSMDISTLQVHAFALPRPEVFA